MVVYTSKVLYTFNKRYIYFLKFSSIQCSFLLLIFCLFVSSGLVYSFALEIYIKCELIGCVF